MEARMETESSSAVVSGVRSTRKKRKVKRKSSKRRPAVQFNPKGKDWQPGGIDHAMLNDLPHSDLPPVEERLEPESEKPSGFLSSLKESLLGPAKSDEPKASSNVSPSGSEPVASPEVEKQLSRVPDVIGDQPDELEAGEPTIGAGDVAALMDAVAFEEQDVKDMLSEMFEWWAERRKREHWKLTDRQVRMLGRPTAQLMNSLWAKLKLRIPDILTSWCESTPGATAFLMAFGLVVVPKVLKDVNLSRARKSKPQEITGRRSTGAPIGPVMPSGIPTAAGVITGDMPSGPTPAGQGGVL